MVVLPQKTSSTAATSRPHSESSASTSKPQSTTLKKQPQQRIFNPGATVRKTSQDTNAPIHPPSFQYPPLQTTSHWTESTGNSLTSTSSGPEPAAMDWALAVIFDFDDLPCNLQEIAKAITKHCDLSYLPHLTLFSDDRAPFFHKTWQNH